MGCDTDVLTITTTRARYDYLVTVLRQVGAGFEEARLAADLWDDLMAAKPEFPPLFDATRVMGALHADAERRRGGA